MSTSRENDGRGGIHSDGHSHHSGNSGSGDDGIDSEGADVSLTALMGKLLPTRSKSDLLADGVDLGGGGQRPRPTEASSNQLLSLFFVACDRHSHTVAPS
jgi:hypothetical protein